MTDRRRLLLATQSLMLAGAGALATLTWAGGAGLLMEVAGYRLEGFGGLTGVGEQRAGE